MILRTLATVVVLLQVAAVSSSGRTPQDRGTAARPLVDGGHLRVQPEDAAIPGSARVVLVGDETKPGVYVYRNTFQPGQMSRPHYHTGDRFVTVIKGTWWTGGLHHFDGAKTEAVTVQIVGVGPIQTVLTEVDATGKPVEQRR